MTETQDPPPGWRHDGHGEVRWWTGTAWQDAPPRSASAFRRFADRFAHPHGEATDDAADSSDAGEPSPAD